MHRGNWSAQTTIKHVHIMSANVHYWHKADIPKPPINVRHWGSDITCHSIDREPVGVNSNRWKQKVRQWPSDCQTVVTFTSNPLPIETAREVINDRQRSCVF